MKMLFSVTLIAVGIGLMLDFEPLTLMNVAGLTLIFIGLKL